MKYRRHHIALLLVVLLALAACGSDDLSLPSDPVGGSGAGPSDTVSLDGAWVLISATVDGRALALDDLYRVTMTIDGSEIGGRAACNGYGGSVTIDNGAFSVGALSQTQMACEPAVMEIESEFMRGLAGVTDAVRTGGTALLTGEGVEYTFDLLPPVPTADLIGVVWVLDTIIQGETASSTIAGADPATLLLNADGTFVGGTGCREISGEYVVSGDTVQFTSFGADGECSSDVERQDGQVIAALEGGFTVAIDGNRLVVTSSGGEGLSYTTG